MRFTTDDKTYAFPPPGFTLHWFDVALNERPDIWRAMWLNVRIALAATAISLVWAPSRPGAQRAKFFGRDTISLLLVLPIALPGIVTSAWRCVQGLRHRRPRLQLLTIVIGHVTFWHRRRPTTRSQGCGGCRPLVGRRWTSGQPGAGVPRYVTLPNVATALAAGALLAFALSFDEVVVTTFTAGQQTTLADLDVLRTRPPRQRPVTNVVAVLVMAMTFVPILNLLDDAQFGGVAGRGNSPSSDRGSDP